MPGMTLSCRASVGGSTSCGHLLMSQHHAAAQLVPTQPFLGICLVLQTLRLPSHVAECLQRRHVKIQLDE
eukprot:4132-Eustigmatos_ZCMA.PRE.1